MRSTGPDLATRQLVVDRDHRRCLRCSAPGEQVHHRKPRGMGGSSLPGINSPENLILLCQRCHAFIESSRAEAYRDGWLVHRGDDPAEVPIRRHGGLVLLFPDGGMEVAPWT